MGWRQILVYTHRWLGIAGGLLFAAWFVSGVVMIYARMPELDAHERRAHLPALDFSAARVAPAGAFAAAPAPPERLRIGMRGGRPVYRAIVQGRWINVFADDGRAPTGLTRDQALTEAARFAGLQAAALRYDRAIDEPDQWTLQARALLPMHRIALGDAHGTVLYVSDRTGEVELKTTAGARRVAYAGAVLHWLYFTPLRRNAAVWSQTIIWLSAAGCVMCLTGLAWGLIVGWRSPYRGLLRWHHYAGLVFGVTTFTWVFSGLLSMDPWDWHPPTAPSRVQRSAMTGAPLDLSALTIDRLRIALDMLSARGGRDADLIQFRGEPFLAAEHQLVSLPHPERGVFSRFSDADIESAAREAMPAVPVEEARWLSAYDAYYYDRDGALALPVLRLKFADSRATWLYVDPGRGAIVRKEERLTRLNRWLYHGFHSLDLPWLYARRPLWDAVMIVLSVGGLASAVTSLPPAWRRLRDALRRGAVRRSRSARSA